MGNSFGPNGFSIGSSRHVSSSKYPKSYCMKVTSQMRSPTCVTPTCCPAKTWLKSIFRPLKQIRPHDVDGLVVKRIDQILESAIEPPRPGVRIGRAPHLELARVL